MNHNVTSLIEVYLWQLKIYFDIVDAIHFDTVDAIYLAT